MRKYLKFFIVIITSVVSLNTTAQEAVSSIVEQEKIKEKKYISANTDEKNYISKYTFRHYGEDELRYMQIEDIEIDEMLKMGFVVEVSNGNEKCFISHDFEYVIMGNRPMTFEMFSMKYYDYFKNQIDFRNKKIYNNE